MGSWKNINWTKWIAIGLAAIGVVLYVIVEMDPLGMFFTGFSSYIERAGLLRYWPLATSILVVSFLIIGWWRTHWLKKIVTTVIQDWWLGFKGAVLKLNEHVRWVTLAKGWRKMKINLNVLKLEEVFERNSDDDITVAHVAVRLAAVEHVTGNNPANIPELFIKQINGRLDQEFITNIRQRPGQGGMAYEALLSAVAVEIVRQWTKDDDKKLLSSMWEIPKDVIIPFVKEGLAYKTVPATTIPQKPGIE